MQQLQCVSVHHCDSFKLWIELQKKKRKSIWSYCKIRNEGPLLDWLVVGGLTPHEGEVKRQAGVIRTRHHGGHEGFWKE